MFLYSCDLIVIFLFHFSFVIFHKFYPQNPYLKE